MVVVVSIVLSAVVDRDSDVTFDVVVSVSFSFADVTVICVVVVVEGCWDLMNPRASLTTFP